MKPNNLISHLLSKTEQNEISEEIICFYESQETFVKNLMENVKPATIKAYIEILLVKIRKDTTSDFNLILSIEQIIEMISRIEVKKDEYETFHRILDILALTLYFECHKTSEDEHLFTKIDQKNFYISHLLFKSLLDRGVIHDKDQILVKDIIERLSCVIKEESRAMSPIYCIAVETIKLLFNEKIINPLKFLSRILKPLRKTDIESFAIILCDFIEYVPNKKLGLCQAMNMLNELDLFLLLEKSVRKVKNPEIDTKRCFFLLKNCVELFRELNLPYKSDLMSWNPDKTQEYTNAWDKFFTIVESLKENMKHLIIPAFGLLTQLDILGARWKICLLERGFQNDNVTVQTFCANYLLKSKDLWKDIGNGADSAFTSVINNASLFSRDSTFDTHRYCEFVQTHPNFVQLDQLQKSVPIYFTVRGLFKRMKDMKEPEQEEALEYLNQILASLNMVHNTLIRMEIIERVVVFIFQRKWYELLLRLNLSYLLEPNDGTLENAIPGTCDVPWTTLVSIYSSSLPMVLKSKFTCTEIDFDDSAAPKLIFVHMLFNDFPDNHKQKFEKLLLEFLQIFESSIAVLPTIDSTWIEQLVLNYGKFSIHSSIQTYIEKLTQLLVLHIMNHTTPLQTKATLAQIMKCVSMNEILTSSVTIKTSLEFLTGSMQLMCKTSVGQSKGKGDGEIFSKFYQALSVIRSNVYQWYGVDQAKVLEELEFTLYLMDVGGSRILTSEMKTLKIIFNKHLTSNIPDDSIILDESISIVERCFTEMMSYRRFDYFWECLESFVEMILSPVLFHRWNEQIIVPYYTKFMKMADATQGVAQIILTNLFNLSVEDFRNISSYQEILLWGLLFGEQYNRNKRTETEVCMEIHQEKPYLTTRYQYRESADVRALSVAMLLKLCDPKTRKSTEIANLFHTLFKKYTTITANHSRCYADSQVHLDKLRICQALLVLPVMEGQFREMIKLSTFFDSNLPNVSYLLEVLFARTASDKYLEEILTDQFMKELRPAGAESLFIILYYRCCTEKTQPTAFLDKIIKKILPFAMGQHFATRLYAQTVLRKLIDRRLYQDGNELRLKLIKEGLDKSFELMGDTKNLRSFSDIRFAIIENLGNFNLETIFHHIPRMTDLSLPEQITCQMLNNAFRLIKFEKTLTPITPELCEKVFKQIQSNNMSDPETPELITTTNVQTKIIPTKQMLPSTHLSEIYPTKYLTNKSCHSSLIVIATLITKQPNLGGLARTCEIFNIDQYIVESLQKTEMIGFQSLSMSADKWLKMAEVKPGDLAEYLKILKMQGYVVVGAEQTAHSRQITKFKFPKKTALLLGNEKEGIPGNLISLLDYAVEIPQFGVCRSLNVHVCGSIFIWEYAKQHQITMK